MRIGFVHKGYPEIRNIITPWKRKASLVKIIDNFKILDWLVFKIFNKTNFTIHNLVFGFLLSYRVDYLHLFNGIWLKAKKPWITNFETILPRINDNSIFENWALKAIVDDNCKALIAMSKCSATLQKNYIEKQYPHLAPKIIPKIKQLYPPQTFEKDVSFENTEHFSVLFTGVDFYRKGGLPLIKAFNKWSEGKNNIRLTIISKLKQGYISDYTKEDHLLVEQIIKINKQIDHIYYASNKEVIDNCKQADVIMLPTYADTFGYSILEGMANACIPVVTNIRALPELVENGRGCCLTLSLDDNKNLSNTISIKEHSALLTLKIEECLNELYAEWESNELKVRKKKCYNWIKEYCNSDTYTENLINMLTNFD